MNATGAVVVSQERHGGASIVGRVTWVNPAGTVGGVGTVGIAQARMREDGVAGPCSGVGWIVWGAAPSRILEGSDSTLTVDGDVTIGTVGGHYQNGLLPAVLSLALRSRLLPGCRPRGHRPVPCTAPCWARSPTCGWRCTSASRRGVWSAEACAACHAGSGTRRTQTTTATPIRAAGLRRAAAALVLSGSLGHWLPVRRSISSRLAEKRFGLIKRYLVSVVDRSIETLVLVIAAGRDSSPS